MTQRIRKQREGGSENIPSGTGGMAHKAVREVLVEPYGDLRLVLGGKQGYVRVRGGVGKGGRQFQGYTIDKKNTTAAFDSPRAAGIALAALERDLAAGLNKAARKAKRGAAKAPFQSFPIPGTFLSILFLIPSSPHILRLLCVPQNRTARPPRRRLRCPRC